MWKQELPKNPQHSSYPALMSAPCIQYPRYSASPARSLRTTTHTVLAAMIQTQPWYLSLIYRNSIISSPMSGVPSSTSTSVSTSSSTAIGPTSSTSTAALYREHLPTLNIRVACMAFDLTDITLLHCIAKLISSALP
ncbi:hypothetical protein M404DRAFT_901611 [Pisolithus tinctorius Marx 270]|uniref:Uncharacterized protein n=1 Tax=Pisolithus tinctorius Marx 270 TaxID=870435 RepID=A0A0C3PN82_PISTI|nr:hypothetical protein M404DRAFT_901611 [Pisolithus tinctorius Marx 270]